jgi:hypothetical protein
MLTWIVEQPAVFKSIISVFLTILWADLIKLRWVGHIAYMRTGKDMHSFDENIK